MWIFLGCALAARQWERVWQPTAHGVRSQNRGQLGSGRSHGRGFVRAPSARQTDQAMTTPGRSAPDSGPNCVRASVKLEPYSRLRPD